MSPTAANATDPAVGEAQQTDAKLPECHFISNTHWDREWRYSMQRTRQPQGKRATTEAQRWSRRWDAAQGGCPLVGQLP